MSLPTIVANLRGVVAGLADMRRAYDDPPESINETPAAVIYVLRGELREVSHGFDQNTHTVAVEIYLSKTLLPQAVNQAKVWPERFLAALKADPDLDGSIAHIVWPITYRAGPIEYGTINGVAHRYYGVRFEVTVRDKQS